MTKLGIFAATILAAAGACCGVSAAEAAPKTCTGLWDFIENRLPADLVRHHALRRDRRGLHLPDSWRAA